MMLLRGSCMAGPSPLCCRDRLGPDYMTEFDRKIVVVTGASSGIGRAAAELFAARGARVALLARSREKIEAIAARHGDRMLAVVGDVSDPADVERLFAEVETR